MPRIEGYTKADLDVQSIQDGVYKLRIVKVEDNTSELEWADLSLRITFESPDGTIPFNITRNFAVTFPKDGKKGSVFIMNELLSACEVEVKNGNFNHNEMVNKIITAVVYKGENGFMEVFQRIMPGEATDDQISRIMSLFRKDIRSGRVTLFNPSMPTTRNDSSTQESNDPLSTSHHQALDGPSGSDEDLPF
jgi:hypothetical protein